MCSYFFIGYLFYVSLIIKLEKLILYPFSSSFLKLGSLLLFFPIQASFVMDVVIVLLLQSQCLINMNKLCCFIYIYI